MPATSEKPRAPRGNHSGQRARARARTELAGEIAADLADDYELVRDTLRTSLEAKKRTWLSCPHCKKKTELEVPDTIAALKAAQVWFDRVIGRPEQKTEVSVEHSAPNGEIERAALLAELVRQRPEISQTVGLLTPLAELAPAPAADEDADA